MKYFLIIFLFSSSFLFSQEQFVNPLNIPMYLSGSFAELRSNHFHSGIDIKTNEKIGYPVFSIADGWVSRVKVSPWGFGHVVYITHYNGYTSVYAHLEKFNKRISDLVLEEQYRKKSFSIDKYFKKDKILIKQSEIIAFSGNTGGSGGPHLHFEMRETQSQKPINPLEFNFDIEDTIPPMFKALVMYQQNEKSFFKPILSKQLYLISDTIIVNDSFEVGIVTRDESNNSDNRLGVNKIYYYLDDVLMYSYENEKFSYAETRYANAHIDFEEYKLNGRRIQKLFVEPGNHLNCYPVFGKYKSINCNSISLGRIEIYDSKNNKSTLEFIVKRVCQTKHDSKITLDKNSKQFSYNEDNTFKTSNVEVFLPKGALYSNINFSISENEDNNFIGNRIYSICRETIALQKKINLKIKFPSIEQPLRKKLVIVKKKKKSLTAVKTSIDGVYLKARVREFGDYAISIDTIPPSVRFRTFNDTDTTKAFLSFSISDNLSGISSYNGYVDGQWILFQYDYKTHQLFYCLDKHLRRENRERNILIKVSDAVGNISTYKQTIIY